MTAQQADSSAGLRRLCDAGAEHASAGAALHTSVVDLAPRRLMTPRQLAAHSQLYEFVSFTNAAQWTAVNARLWNVYRVASQGNNRARQAQALEDILMLPQRTLTRTSRGAGDGQRLTSIIKGRCRDLGIAIRQQYGCMPVRDNNVKLDLITEQLSHVDVIGPESTADASTADTDVDDSDAETIPPTQESIQAEDAEEEEEEEEEDDDYSGTWSSKVPRRRCRRGPSGSQARTAPCAPRPPEQGCADAVLGDGAGRPPPTGEPADHARPAPAFTARVRCCPACLSTPLR